MEEYLRRIAEALEAHNEILKKRDARCQELEQEQMAMEREQAAMGKERHAALMATEHEHKRKECWDRRFIANFGYKDDENDKEIAKFFQQHIMELPESPELADAMVSRVKLYLAEGKRLTLDVLNQAYDESVAESGTSALERMLGNE